MSQSGSAAESELTSVVARLAGGHFSAKSAGGDVYEEAVSKIRAHSDEALAEFTAMFLGAGFDPMRHAAEFPERVLEILRDVNPGGTRTTAESLLRHYDGVLFLYDRSADKDTVLHGLSDDSKFVTIRLLQRREQVRTLIEGL